eukprot:TRINITY_DN24315_c0_g1_i1.p1 TRINITY_DN24315_c0_g1~~TRINITY_DN24315_c0_g1_i1.p1  ORF type:complete len:1221 (+),score=216.04 TRINITY_DN24315_c0_g1_i1:80-3742(+)
MSMKRSGSQRGSTQHAEGTLPRVASQRRSLTPEPMHRPSFASSRWKTTGLKLKAAIRFKLAAVNGDSGTTPRGDDSPTGGDGAAPAAAKMSPTDKEIADIQRYATQMLDSGAVKDTVVVGADGRSPKRVDVRTQANPEFYTPEALRTRKSIRRAPAFVEACQRFWEVIPKHTRGIDRGMYITVFAALAANKELLPGSPGSDAAARSLEKEWAYDSQGIEWLDLSSFTDAVFDLVDTWTDGVDEHGYAEVVDKMVEMFKEDPLPDTRPGEWHWGHPSDPSTWKKCGAAMGHHLENAFARDRRDQVPLPGLHVDPIGAACMNGVNVDFLRMKLQLHSGGDRGGMAMTYHLKRLAKRPEYVRRGMPGWVEMKRKSSVRLPVRPEEDSRRHSKSQSPTRDAPGKMSPTGSFRRRPPTESREGEAPVSGPLPVADGMLLIQCRGKEFAVPADTVNKFPESVCTILRRARRSTVHKSSVAKPATEAEEEAGSPDSPNALLLQRDPVLFELVVAYLTAGTRPKPPGDPAAAASLVAEWEFWGLPLKALVPHTSAAGSGSSGCVIKLMKQQGGRLPPLQLTAGDSVPPHVTELCGHYQPIATGAGRDGQPIWQCAEGRIFSAKGVWMVGTAADMKRGVGVIAAAVEHQGRPPFDPTLGVWKVSKSKGEEDTSQWVDDPSVLVSSSTAPPDLHVTATRDPMDDALKGPYKMIPRVCTRGWPVWERDTRDAWICSDEKGRWRISKQRPKDAVGPRRNTASGSQSPPSSPTTPDISFVSVDPHHGEMPSVLTRWLRCVHESEELPLASVQVRQVRAGGGDGPTGPRKMLKMIAAQLLLDHPDTPLGRTALIALLSQPWFAAGKGGTVEVDLPGGAEDVLAYALQWYRTGSCTLPPMDAAALRLALRTLLTVFGVPEGDVRVAGRCRLFGFGFGGCPEDLRAAAAEDRESGSDIPHSVQGACLRCARLATELLAAGPDPELPLAKPQSPPAASRGSQAFVGSPRRASSASPRRRSQATPVSVSPSQTTLPPAARRPSEQSPRRQSTASGTQTLSPIQGRQQSGSAEPQSGGKEGGGGGGGGGQSPRKSQPVLQAIPAGRQLSPQPSPAPDHIRRSSRDSTGQHRDCGSLEPAARLSLGASGQPLSPIGQQARRTSLSRVTPPAAGSPLPSLTGIAVGGGGSFGAQGRRPLSPIGSGSSSPLNRSAHSASGSPAAGSPARSLRHSLTHNPGSK